MLKKTLARLRHGDHPTWIRQSLQMRRLVRRAALQLTPPSGSGNRVGIVVLPWSGSAVPWFSIACGLLLRQRGLQVSFILDDLPFGSTRLGWRVQLAGIRAVLALLRKHFTVHVLSRLGDAPARPGPAPATADLQQLAELNAIWTGRGESGADPRQIEATTPQLAAADAVIGRFLDTEPFDTLFVSGGVWGTSGLWLHHAQQHQVRVATYDSGGYSTLLLSSDGIACQLQDIPRAYTLLKSSLNSREDTDWVQRTARAEMQKRRAGTDTFASQVGSHAGANPRWNGCFLIPLNSSWDSAALGLHTAFGSTREWIVETVRHLLEHTTAPVVVRQHPVERLEIARSVDDYRAMLADAFGSHPRLHFVAAADPVNSYALLDQALAVVAYTSTIGVEAAASGKPVITQSRSYYSRLGFVFSASTREAYFDLLRQAGAGTLEVTAAMREDAIACYYITQCCNWVFTPFTVPGFEEWARLDLDAIAQLPNVRLVIDTIADGTPAAYLNHLARRSKEPDDAV